MIKIKAIWPDKYVREFDVKSFSLTTASGMAIITLEDGYNFACPHIEVIGEGQTEYGPVGTVMIPQREIFKEKI